MLQRPWLAVLIGIALFAGVIGATYGYLEAAPSPVVGLGLNLLCFLAVALWVKADAREHQMPLVFD